MTAAQIYATWSKISETLWKRDELQFPSAEKLLTEYLDEVDTFDVPKVDGVQQLCWGMKRIYHELKAKVVEIGVDVTCVYEFAGSTALFLIYLHQIIHTQSTWSYTVLWANMTMWDSHCPIASFLPQQL